MPEIRRPSAGRYDVIIIGSGPAGIFAALELSRREDLSILILDKGADLEKRSCPSRESGVRCRSCRPCSILCGWGGAGAFSDGKLTLSAEVGGWLPEIIGREKVGELIEQVDRLYLSFGAPEHVYRADSDAVEQLRRRAALSELQLVYFPVRHLGSDGSGRVLSAMREELVRRGVEIRMRTEVAHILVEDSQVRGVETANGETILGRYVLAAPGREGTRWLVNMAQELKLALGQNPVDVGVRVELPAAVLQPLTDVLYEPKLHYYSKTFDDAVRTFCVCPFGEVVSESFDGIKTVNGHSYAGKKTPYTNFALLVHKNFTEPFKDPVAYGRYIAGLANLLSGGVMVQRLGDLEQGRRTDEKRLQRCVVTPTLKSAAPGDLGLVLPYRYIVNLLEMLKALDKFAPGVYSRHTLLYGIEVKFYSSRLHLNEGLETEIKNLFAAGDGAGITRGLVQASASGLIAARQILSG